MHKRKSLGIVGLLFVGGVVVLAAMFFFVAPLLGHSKDSQQSCAQTGVQYTAVVKDGTITPKHIDAKQCDTLTITNEDSKARLMAFGVHERHVAYNGISERRLEQGQSFTVTLTKTGEYLFHDHFDEDAGGTFTVTN